MERVDSITQTLPLFGFTVSCELIVDGQFPYALPYPLNQTVSTLQHTNTHSHTDAQTHKVTHQLLQKAQDRVVQSSPRLCIAYPPFLPLVCTYCYHVVRPCTYSKKIVLSIVYPILILALCVVYGEWVNLVMVSAWHLLL